MSSSEERVGGVEPETVDEFLEDGQVVLWRVREKGASEDEWSAWTDFDFESSHEFYDRSMVEVEEVKFVPLSALRLVEEELRQVRKLWGDAEGAANFARHEQRVAETELRQAREERDALAKDADEIAFALVKRTQQRDKAEADLDLLNRRFALVADRSGVRAQALQLAQECITENVANGEGVDSQPAVLDAIFDALKYEIADEPDDARPGAKPPIQSTDALSPVQGEHEQDGEDTGVVGDSALSGESVRGVASMLAEFHAHPNADEATNSRELRYVLHVEEAAELADELDHEDDGEWDREKIARETADVVYVAYGTAHVFDIDLDVALAEIHRAAMRKLDANVRRADGKIVKPPGFVPPDMSGALRDVSWRAEWLPSGCGETAQDGDTEETT